MSTSKVIVGVALAAVVMLAAYAWAQNTPAQPKQDNGDCPACRSGSGREKAFDPETRKLLDEAGITDEMLTRQKAMMNAPLLAGDPALLMGMEESLEITPEQKQKLQQIQKQSAKQAMAVLTVEQKQKLGKTPTEAMSPMQGMQQIHRKLRTLMEKRGGENGHCPMMPDEGPQKAPVKGM